MHASAHHIALALGYKVGVVEQMETPDQLAQRNAQKPKGVKKERKSKDDDDEPNAKVKRAVPAGNKYAPQLATSRRE